MRRNQFVWGISGVLVLFSIVAVGGHLWTGNAAPVPASAPVPALSSSPAFEVAAEARPLVFEANHGQTDPRVEYLARANGTTLFLTSQDFVLKLCGSDEVTGTAACEAVEMSLVGGSRNPEIAGLEPLPGVSNYLIGNDPAAWHTDVPQFARVRYEQVYPGIDLVFYGNQRQFEYDFVLAPGVDPSIIQLDFAGAEAVALDEEGNLVISVSNGELVQPAPVIYQESDGSQTTVQGGYTLSEAGLVSFGVGVYDEARPLVIDPMLAFSTYFGGTGTDTGNGIAVDSSGNVYVAGATWTADFPTENAMTPGYQGNRDGFVAKLSPGGGTTIFSTYLGASGSDTCEDIAIDSDRNVYLTGFTSSTNFPTANALYPDLTPLAPDAFVVKMNPSGSALLFSSYLGGSGYDYGYSIDLDSSGSIYLSGYTESPDFPTANALDGILNDAPPNTNRDAYITKLPASVDSLTWSTYLGGSSADKANGMAVDHAGNVYVTGKTQSGDFPTLNAAQPLAGGGTGEAFVTQVHANGSSLVYSTYLGGSSDEDGNDVWVDGNQRAYVVAMTESADFLTANAYQPDLAGTWDTTITELAADGSLVFSTYLGAPGWDRGRTIGVDGPGNIYVAGETDSTDFPTVDAFQVEHHGSYDAFVARLSPGGRVLAYSTYFGGAQSEYAWDLDFDAQGALYIVGQTGSSDLPTVAAVQPTHGGSNDGYIAKLTIPLDFFITAIPDAGRLIAVEEDS